MRIRFQLIVFALALGAVATISAQAPEWRLTAPLGDAEKARVLSLAATLKIERPGVIRSEQIYHPLNCDALRIESVPAIDGHRRTWKRVWVTYTSRAHSCDLHRAQRSPPDTWVAADEVSDVGAWRVSVAGSDIDVETPASISYAETRAIVEAVRTHTLVDRMPPQKGLRPIPKVDAKSIVAIWTDSLDPSLYAVRFRNMNVVFLVVVRGNQVQLRSWRLGEIA